MVIKKKTTPPKKTTTSTKPTPKVAARAPVPAPTPTPSAVPAAKMVRRKELVERIVATSGLKPNQVKSVLDAVFLEMGKALSNGEGLNIHPLGKITVNRKKELEDREVIVCKIRRKVSSTDAPLSTATE